MDYESLKNKYVFIADVIDNLFWENNYSKSELLKKSKVDIIPDLMPLSLNDLNILYGVEFYSTMNGKTCVFCHRDKSYLEKISDDIADYFFNKVTDTDYDFDNEFKKFLSKYDLKYFSNDGANIGDYYSTEYLITDKSLLDIVESIKGDKLPDYYDLKSLGNLVEISTGEDYWSGEDYLIFVIKRIEERF